MKKTTKFKGKRFKCRLILWMTNCSLNHGNSRIEDLWSLSMFKD